MGLHGQAPAAAALGAGLPRMAVPAGASWRLNRSRQRMPQCTAKRRCAASSQSARRHETVETAEELPEEHRRGGADGAGAWRAQAQAPYRCRLLKRTRTAAPGGRPTRRQRGCRRSSPCTAGAAGRSAPPSSTWRDTGRSPGMQAVLKTISAQARLCVCAHVCACVAVGVGGWVGGWMDEVGGDGGCGGLFWKVCGTPKNRSPGTAWRCAGAGGPALCSQPLKGQHPALRTGADE